MRGEIRPGGTEREWCDPDVLRRIRRATLRCSGARSSRRSRRPSAASSPRGTGSAGARRSARHSSRCRQSRCRSRSGRATCSRAASPGTDPPISTRSVRRATSCGSGPGSTALPSTSVRTPRSSARRRRRRRPRARRTQRCGSRSRRERCSGPTSSKPPGSTPPMRSPRSGTSCGPARSRTTRGHPSRRPPLRVPAPGAPPAALLARAPRFPRPTQGRWSTAAQLFSGSSTAAPSRSSCSSARASSPGTAFGRGSGAATAPCTRSSARSRRSARAAAATSSRVSAAPSSPCRVRSSACGNAVGGESRSSSCSPPPTRRSRTAPRCPGRAAPVHGPHASPVRGSCCRTARRVSRRAGRTLARAPCEPDPEWLRSAFAALVAHVRAGGAKRLAVERFDGAPVAESDAMPLLVDAGFLAGPRRACAPVAALRDAERQRGLLLDVDESTSAATPSTYGRSRRAHTTAPVVGQADAPGGRSRRRRDPDG